MQGMEGMMGMEAFAGIPMTREASGTSWQPDSTPMHAHHEMKGLWRIMQHYNAFLSYDHQNGPRGNDQVNGIGWYMLMASRPLGRGDLMLRIMLSPEPATTTARGYPLLFQSGEAYHGQPLVDRQHPHDFFMEVAGRYRYALDAQTAAFLYLAPSGEPALGPTAFPHRTSAMDNPAAPITHHWQDSTHIAFGVLTAGVSRSNWQVEGSYFNGREPDENRWDFDPIRLDSFSGRISYNPGPNWSTQVSYGWLKSPEELRPNETRRRATLSATYNQPRRDGGNWASTFAWGRNNGAGINSDGVLLETDLNLADRNAFLGRLEFVDKLGEDLALTPADKKFGITELTLGGLHELTPGRSYQAGVGASVTFNWKPAELDPVYGRSPLGFWVFLRIRPSRMDMGGSHAMTMEPPKPEPPAAERLGIAAAISPNPPRVGAANRMVVTLTDSTGKPVTGAKVTSEVGMTSMNMGTGRPLFRDLGDGRYQGSPRFSMPGPWRVRLTVTHRTASPLPAVLTTP